MLEEYDRYFPEMEDKTDDEIEKDAEDAKEILDKENLNGVNDN